MYTYYVSRKTNFAMLTLKNLVRLSIFNIMHKRDEDILQDRDEKFSEGVKFQER